MDARVSNAGSFKTTDWTAVAAALDQEGYAVLPGLLGAPACAALAQRLRAAPRGPWQPALDAAPTGGECWPVHAPVASLAPLGDWREELYPHLASIANRWFETLQQPLRFPARFAQVQSAGNGAGASPITASRLGVGGCQPLQHSLTSPDAFPLQLVLLLSAPELDFEGGEFVMTEQRPRMQSRPMVLPLHQGDAALIAVAQRPVRGSKGFYRVSTKHAVSAVRRGERVGVEMVFDVVCDMVCDTERPSLSR